MAFSNWAGVMGWGMGSISWAFIDALCICVHIWFVRRIYIIEYYLLPSLFIYWDFKEPQKIFGRSLLMGAWLPAFSGYKPVVPWKVSVGPQGDLCCYLVLSHGVKDETSFMDALLVISCALDLLQAMTTSYRFHWLPIQLAGFAMCLSG